MSRRITVYVLSTLALVLSLAACGGGSKTAASSAAQSGAATVPPTTAPPASVPTTATTSTVSPSNGSATAVLPANFVVNADGSVSPPVVAGPVDTRIELTVISRSSHPATIKVASTSITVPPGAHATTRLPVLKAGRYPITVDGRPRAAIVVGAQPGP